MKKFHAALVFALTTEFAFAVGLAPDTLISHRGESVDAPENTLPACRMAVDRGFGFECDVERVGTGPAKRL